MKKLLTVILALTMALVLAVPAFAAPRGRGYADGTVKINGKSYSVRVEIHTDSNHAAYTTCNTAANVRRLHKEVSVTYITAHNGYIPRSDGESDTIYPMVGLSKSGTVPFNMTADEYRGIKGMGGSVILYGDTTVTLRASVS